MQDLQGGFFRCFLLDGHGQAGDNPKPSVHSTKLSLCNSPKPAVTLSWLTLLYVLYQCFHWQLVKILQFILDVWHQVLAALDKAFSKLGFTHADMRISNVMEHHLDAQPMYPKGFASKKQRKTVGVLMEPKTNTFSIPGQSHPKGRV